MEHDIGTRLDWVALDHWNHRQIRTSISSCAALTINPTPSSSIATTSVTHTRDLFPESSGYPDKANAANIRIGLGCFSRLPTFASPSKHDVLILSAPVFIKQNQMRNQNSGRPGPSRPMSSLGSLALGARSSEFLK
jgi:hypothetical protein